MLKKILFKIVILILLPLFSICQIINEDEGLFRLKSLRIKNEIDTLNQSLPSAGNYYITFRNKINIHDDVDVRAVDVNYKEYEIKKLDSALLLEIDKPTYISLIFQIKNKNLVDPQVSIALGYPLSPNKNISPFVVKDIEDKEIVSDSLKGKIIVLNYWGLSCGPCIKEIPLLNNLSEKLSFRDDIIFLAINPDSKDETKKFLEKHEFNYQIIAGKANAKKLDFSTELWARPFHVIINRNGQIVFNLYGSTNNIGEILKERIERLN